MPLCCASYTSEGIRTTEELEEFHRQGYGITNPEWYGKVHTISTLDAKGNVIKTEQVKADSLGNIVWKDGKEYKQPPGHLPKYTSFKMNGKTYTMVEKYGQMPEIREGRY